MKHRKSGSAGFSLIEVSATLALIGFAMIALIGVLPVGLEQARTSINETRAAQLLGMVLSSLEGEPLTQAQCFGLGLMPPLDLSTLDNTTGPASIFLFASYDVRQRAAIERADKPPQQAEYRIELRSKPVPARRDDPAGPKRGCFVQVKIALVASDSPPLLELTHFLSSLTHGSQGGNAPSPAPAPAL